MNPNYRDQFFYAGGKEDDKVSDTKQAGFTDFRFPHIVDLIAYLYILFSKIYYHDHELLQIPQRQRPHVVVWRADHVYHRTGAL